MDERARVFTVRQVGEALQLDDHRVRRLIHSGELRASRIGRFFRIREEDLENLLDATLVSNGAA